MLLSFLLGAAALAAVIDAQSTGNSTITQAPTSTSATPSSTAAVTHTVAVGINGYVYTPNNINASVGDFVRWIFYPGGHTVVRAEYKYPCIPYEDTGIGKVGFYSGQISPQAITDDLPTFQLRINDTDPIFFYCSAPGSCYQQHMIGVINENATETLAVQEQFADNSTYQLSPGQPFPSETVNPTSATPTATSTSQSSSDSGSSSSLGAGQIAGIAIGAAAVVVLAGALLYLCGRRGGLDMAYRRSTQTIPPPALVEARFAPRSPGEDTFASTQYQRSPGRENFTYSDNSPPVSHYVSSPPMSPGSHPTYGVFPGPGNQVHSPLMGGADDGRGYYDHTPQETPPPPPTQSSQPPQEAPVELPTSDDPGNSPLPSYRPSRQFSWAQGSESTYRPSSKN